MIDIAFASFSQVLYKLKQRAVNKFLTKKERTATDIYRRPRNVCGKTKIDESAKMKETV